MSEEFLHFIWQHKLYKPGMFYTSDDQFLEIIHPGLPNDHAGPDFFNAKIKLDGTLWAGNVEIHQRASDWFRHKHHNDLHYDNVVLHVVIDNDEQAYSRSGRILPAWEMEVDDALLNRYQRLYAHSGWVACEGRTDVVPAIEINSWIERMVAEKLEHKVGGIESLLEAYNNDWAEAFYVILARNFGFGLNGEPFERLARQTSWKIVGRNADSQLKLEALFLGQGGFLEGLVFDDDHINHLAREYTVLRKKYNLEPLPQHLWKFLRLRPGNFPTIRLVQLAALFARRSSLFDVLLQCEELSQARELFQSEPLPYWDHHYRPGVKGGKKSKKLGRQAIDLIIINTVIPLFFAYGKLRGQPKLEDRAIEWLGGMPPETNRIVKKWSQIDDRFKACTAADSQGLVFLKRHYCDHHKCLRCRIGHKIVVRENKK